MISLFDTQYRVMFSNMLNPEFLANGGYNTYGYLEDNIASVVMNVQKIERDKFRAIKIGGVEDLNIWSIYYKDFDYSKKMTKEEREDYERRATSPFNTYIGSSITPVLQDQYVVDERNVILDSKNITNIVEINDIYTYFIKTWRALEYVKPGLIPSFFVANVYLLGNKVDTSYKGMAAYYQLQKMVDENRCKNTVIEKLIETDYPDYYPFAFENQSEFHNYIKLVDKYSKR